MKERPILFNGQMVRAILEGRKTQTRRIVKPQPDESMKALDGGRWMWVHDSDDRYLNFDTGLCPFGQPCDRLWVRETWQHSNYPFGPLDKDCVIYYRDDYHDDPHGFDGEKSPEGKYRDWKPSIHMPRWASRINLEITGVRCERLQDISQSDAQAEGWNPVSEDGRNPAPNDPRSWYRLLWESINGSGSWDANPWVWVIEFELVLP